MDNQNQIQLLPDNIKKYLNDRGLSDRILNNRQISYDGRIVIPVFDSTGKKLFNKYRRDPSNHDKGPKYTYDKGAKTALYGLDVISHSNEVIICEGELDAICLMSNGFLGVTSTGGAGTWLPEWSNYFAGKKIYVCFDNDTAGRQGLVKVISHISHALCLPLPGDIKDITEYFVNLKKTPADFRYLMEHAAFEIEVPKSEPPKPKRDRRDLSGNDDFSKAKQVPIGEFIRLNLDKTAPCPFHKEKTASFKVDKNNRFYCYGCSKWGDVIDVVKQIMNLGSTREAVDYILKK